MPKRATPATLQAMVSVAIMDSAVIVVFGSHFPFWSTGGGWMDPEEIAVIPQFAAAVPIDVPPADPKFLFSPIPSSASPAGSHTVIVQRGSQIEVQSFPAAR